MTSTEGDLLNWIKVFLTCWLPVISGVPYLGPTVVYFICDIKSVISHSYLKMFADDLTLYRNIASVSDCELSSYNGILGGYMSGP